MNILCSSGFLQIISLTFMALFEALTFKAGRFFGFCSF